MDVCVHGCLWTVRALLYLWMRSFIAQLVGSSIKY
jgi:hypothetical protein